MNEVREHRTLDRVFFVSLILKGLDGVLELVGGVLLLFIKPDQIDAIVRALTQHELSEDPHDLIATTLRHWTGNLSTSASLFGAVYLLLHGLVKVVLVWAVLRDRLWAYPWMIGFLLVFIVYQGYELIVAFSWGLLLLTLFDIFIVLLTWREYGLHRARRREAATADA
ncbi:MAG TPA: DUF2127 domain-containing protein [Leifsonia sp.]|nr:DUF2127 domain-containing protein [Leifsonia sp.]